MEGAEPEARPQIDLLHDAGKIEEFGEPDGRPIHVLHQESLPDPAAASPTGSAVNP